MSERRANMWHCGDEQCDCWQPQIIECSDPRGFPWTPIWRGTFLSQPSADEIEALETELEQARIQHGIVAGEQP